MLDELIGRRFAVVGRRVLIPRSDIARNVLPEGLRVAGAEVDDVETSIATCGRGGCSASACASSSSESFDVLTFASPSAVRHFVRRCSMRRPERRSPGAMVAAMGAPRSDALR